jgi:hypothetical protein
VWVRRGRGALATHCRPARFDDVCAIAGQRSLALGVEFLLLLLLLMLLLIAPAPALAQEARCDFGPADCLSP